MTNRQLRAPLSVRILGLSGGLALSACTIQGVDDDTDADDDAYGGPSTSDETDAGNSNDSGGSSSNGGDSNTGGTTSGDNGGTDNGGTDNGGTAGGGTDNGGTAGGGTGGDSSTKGGAGGAAQDGDAGAAKGGDTQTGGSGGAGEAPAAEWLDCGDRDVSGAMVVDSALDDEDVTWSGTVRVSGSIAVRDLTLTIEPGTKVIFDADSQIEFADTGNVTKVIAQGTPEEPIRFCGSEGTPGHWGGLVFSETLTEDSVIANVLIADAGANEAALIVNGPLSIDRVQVRNSGADGVLASTFGLQGSELSVQGSLGSAATLESATSVTRFPLGGRFEDNAENIVRVVENIAEEPIVFHDLGIPYLQPESLTAYGEIRFEAGVEYRVGGDASIVVSAAGNGATLFADGTEEEPVVLRGAEETPGSWAGLLIQEGTVETSRLSHLLVSHAGAAETYALSVDEPITLEHVTLDDNVFGAYVGPGGLSSSSTNLRITNTGGPPLTVDPNALIAVPPESSFVGNESDWILVESGAYTVSGNVAAPDVPYRIAGSLSLHSGAVMTLTEGTTFQMAEGGVLRVGAFDEEATFIAVGTEEAPIVFQGVLEEPGSWQGIEIEAPTNESSRLSFVEIGHGGNPDGDGANLTLRRAIGVENCRFFDSEGFGILKEAADLADYTLGNSFENTALDAVGEL